MRVVIAGASGLIGQELLDLCLGDKTIDDVYILVRKPLEIKHEKLTQVSESVLSRTSLQPT